MEFNLCSGVRFEGQENVGGGAEVYYAEEGQGLMIRTIFDA